jgi:hypothetical protein
VKDGPGINMHGRSDLNHFDLFRIKNLFIQGEYNLIRPYMYNHHAALINYSNAREPLAHPNRGKIQKKPLQL